MNIREAIAELEKVLWEEAKLYASLWRRTHRAQRYMVHRQSERLMAMSRSIGELIPQAQASSGRRGGLVQLIQQMLGHGGGPDSLSELLGQLEPEDRLRIAAAHDALAAAAERLYRTNFQNHQLASYSIDLVREEMRILSGDTPDEQAYGAEGEALEAAGASGFMDGRA